MATASPRLYTINYYSLKPLIKPVLWSTQNTTKPRPQKLPIFKVVKKHLFLIEKVHKNCIISPDSNFFDQPRLNKCSKMDHSVVIPVRLSTCALDPVNFESRISKNHNFSKLVKILVNFLCKWRSVASKLKNWNFLNRRNQNITLYRVIPSVNVWKYVHGARWTNERTYYIPPPEKFGKRLKTGLQ